MAFQGRFSRTLKPGNPIKERESLMKKPYLLIGALMIALALWGCASKTADLLKERAGRMNYEEALRRFGPPTRCAEAGTTKTCVWVYGSVSYSFVPFGRHYIPVPSEPPYMRLTFINDVLDSWELRGGWE